MAVFKTNDNVEIYYEVRGEGRPLFLLPGWTCTTKFWQKNVEELSKGCKVIAMECATTRIWTGEILFRISSCRRLCAWQETAMFLTGTAARG